jgi:hypothetical protein
MKVVPTEDYVYPWPVEVRLPSKEKPGEIVTEEFTGMFRLLPDAEAAAIAENLRAPKETAQAYADATKAQIRAVLVGWAPATMPKRFSAEALDSYMTMAPFRDGVLEAYRRSLTQGR